MTPLSASHTSRHLARGAVTGPPVQAQKCWVTARGPQGGGRASGCPVCVPAPHGHGWALVHFCLLVLGTQTSCQWPLGFALGLTEGVYPNSCRFSGKRTAWLIRTDCGTLGLGDRRSLGAEEEMELREVSGPRPSWDGYSGWWRRLHTQAGRCQRSSVPVHSTGVTAEQQCELGMSQLRPPKGGNPGLEVKSLVMVTQLGSSGPGQSQAPGCLQRARQWPWLTGPGL